MLTSEDGFKHNLNFSILYYTIPYCSSLSPSGWDMMASRELLGQVRAGQGSWSEPRHQASPWDRDDTRLAWGPMNGDLEPAFLFSSPPDLQEY